MEGTSCEKCIKEKAGSSPVIKKRTGFPNIVRVS
jgi:hypothetical protein